MTERFELILDYSDELGIKDNNTKLVFVMRADQSTNTVGFCTNIVTLMNDLNTIIETKEKIIMGKSDLVAKQVKVSENLTRRVDELEKKETFFNEQIHELETKADKYIRKQYNLPVGTDLSYWIGVKNTCKKLKKIRGKENGK